MMIYMGLKRYWVIIYEMIFNSNHFPSMIHILLHVNMCVIKIERMNLFIYNSQLNIWYCDNKPYHVILHQIW